MSSFGRLACSYWVLIRTFSHSYLFTEFIFRFFTVSGIKSEGDKFCLEPQTRSCNVPDGTLVVRRSGTKACNEKYGKFTFNSDTGAISHQCSGKMVCPIRNKNLRNAKIVISSMCPKVAGSNFFLRTQGKLLFKTSYYSTFIFAETMGAPKEIV